MGSGNTLDASGCIALWQLRGGAVQVPAAVALHLQARPPRTT